MHGAKVSCIALTKINKCTYSGGKWLSHNNSTRFVSFVAYEYLGYDRIHSHCTLKNGFFSLSLYTHFCSRKARAFVQIYAQEQTMRKRSMRQAMQASTKTLGNSWIYNYCIWHAHSAQVQCVSSLFCFVSSFGIVRCNMYEIEFGRRCSRQGIHSRRRRKKNKSVEHTDERVHMNIALRRNENIYWNPSFLRISKPIRFQVCEALIKTK